MWHRAALWDWVASVEPHVHSTDTCTEQQVLMERETKHVPILLGAHHRCQKRGCRVPADRWKTSEDKKTALVWVSDVKRWEYSRSSSGGYKRHKGVIKTSHRFIEGAKTWCDSCWGSVSSMTASEESRVTGKPAQLHVSFAPSLLWQPEVFTSGFTWAVVPLVPQEKTRLSWKCRFIQ